MLTMRRKMVCVAVVVGASAVAGGCLQRELAPLNPCLVSGVTDKIAVHRVDKVDLLFMIDNSQSMDDKQKNLRQHVPDMVRALVNGKRNDNDPRPFPPVRDLHIAVVDSDMGLVGLPARGSCSGFGHDGEFQHTSLPGGSTGCGAAYPPFLTYTANPASLTADPAAVTKLANDFSCISNVGVTGCGYEQQLEAVLKALWPAKYLDPKTNAPAAKNPISFLTDSSHPEEGFGHGDGSNLGFLRSGVGDDASLLVIIVLSDEDDGSTGDMGLYAAAQAPAWLEPQTKANPNLRSLIGANRDHLYPTSRYINGFRALRADREQLVVYAAITGVPLDLVDDKATANVKFADEAERNAYYDGVLSDPRMQNVVDPVSGSSGLTVKPACGSDMNELGRAYPGRRYVEVAKGIGENATIYSICEDDYTPALNRVIDIVARQLGAVCLPKPLVRDEKGKVKCQVVWELPGPTASHGSAPTACAERGFLRPTDPPSSSPDTGGAICVVDQLKVTGTTVEQGDGWYYDNFSTDATTTCPKATPQRVSFSPSATPLGGVTVKLECLNETQRVVSTRTDIAWDTVVPSIGSSCELGASEMAAMTDETARAMAADAKCAVPLANRGVDTTMFCFHKTNTCVMPCSSATVCPPAWACDDRPETLAVTKSGTHPGGSAVCVNPTCGTE